MSKGNVKDNEYRKFADEAPVGEAWVQVTVRNPEDLVNPGREETGIVGEDISAVKAIYSNGVTLFLGDPDDTYGTASIVGITITSALTGETLKYQLNGPMFDSSFTFTDGQPVFLGPNGSLTQVDPIISGYAYRVLLGVATGSNGLHINIQDPIQI